MGIWVLQKLLPKIIHFHLQKSHYWQYDICRTHNAVYPSVQLYWSRDWGHLTISPLVPNWPQIITKLKGSLSSLKMGVHQDNIQCFSGACVKMVGVQSGSLSHSLQSSAGLCCSDPSRALFDIQRAKMEVKIFHSHEDGYVTVSRPLRSPPALSHGSESCWRFPSEIKA